MRKFRGVVLLLSALLLSGCIVGDIMKNLGVNDPQDQTRSLVFAHVDLSEAPRNIDMDDVFIARVDTKEPEIIRAYADYWDGVSRKMKPGYFWCNDLLPGQYQLQKISGAFMLSGNSTNAQYGTAAGFGHNSLILPTDEKNPSFVDIKKPGFYYMGSFKVTADGDGFRFYPVKHPTEREALERLLKRNRSAYWKPIIEARLAELTKQEQAPRKTAKKGK